MKLRGALFGCGMISEYHLKAWMRIPEVEIAALGNRTITKAEDRRAQFVPNARVYADLKTMLAQEELDFIDILTAPALHREHCNLARQAGLHIICQKPLADSIEQARALAADMEGYSKVFAVHENHRYRPWFQTARAQAMAGDYGPVRLAEFIHLNASGPKEAYKTTSEQGIMIEYGSHVVDMMRSVLGEPMRVYSRMHSINALVCGESLVHAMYEYPQMTATVKVAWKNTGITQGLVVLGGLDGEACYEGTLTRGHTGRFRIARRRELIIDRTLDPMEEYSESFYRLERECVDAMLGKRSSVTQTAAEHLRSLDWTFAAYESARRGEIVDLRP